MKRMFFLMLTLMVLSAASMNAQVTIGSDENPHSSAILDLQSTELGLKLPIVKLDDDLTAFVLTEGTDSKDDAIGMLVYNTNENIGVGLYVWNGSKWCSDVSYEDSEELAVITFQGVSYWPIKFPGTLGTWIPLNMSSLPASYDTYPGYDKGKWGYYYTFEEAQSACPPEFRLPTPDEWVAIHTYFDIPRNAHITIKA